MHSFHSAVTNNWLTEGEEEGETDFSGVAAGCVCITPQSSIVYLTISLRFTDDYHQQTILLASDEIGMKAGTGLSCCFSGTRVRL